MSQDQAKADRTAYRKICFSWMMYDWANSAFYLTIISALFPVFFAQLYIEAHKDEAPQTEIVAGAENAAENAKNAAAADQDLKTQAGASLAFTAAIALVFVALMGPILGAAADGSGHKKRYLAIFAGLGVLSSALMFFLQEDDLFFASVLYVTGTIGVAGSLVFYDALLPSFAKPEDMDRISTLGFALGYVGGLLLLIVNLLWCQHPDWFGLPDATFAMRLSFLSVAVWWAVFSLPLLLKVPEVPREKTAAPRGNPLLTGFRQLAVTAGKIGRYKQLLLFLAAFWLYNDGIGTVFKLAAAFGGMVGVEPADLLLAMILANVVGIPCAFGFGVLAGRLGAKTAILIGLAGYVGICVFGFFMPLPSEAAPEDVEAVKVHATRLFLILAAAVGVVQGGCQALSRSLFASMIPPSQSGEFFGFFSTSAKVAGILGPVLLGFIWLNGDDPRVGILALAIFFLAGGALLFFVDVDAARKTAREEEEASDEPESTESAPAEEEGTTADE